MLKVYLSPWGLLLWTLLFFFMESNVFISLVSAVCVHEFGHVVALNAMGSKVDMISISLSGFQIDYSKSLSAYEEIISAISGPMFGILWFILARHLGLELTAWLSLALSIFNLLPISILDGGRVLNGFFRLKVNKKFIHMYTKSVDKFVCIFLAVLGTVLAICGYGLSLLTASAFLIIYTLVKNN